MDSPNLREPTTQPTCRIDVTLNPPSWLDRLLRPNVVVEINKKAHMVRWGDHSFTVDPGTYEVAVFYVGFISEVADLTTARFTLRPGETKHVHYNASFTSAIKGDLYVR